MNQRPQSQTLRHQRRLTFEQCEPRLTLSGDGGFVILQAGDYILPDSNDFVHTNGAAFDTDSVLAIPRSAFLQYSSDNSTFGADSTSYLASINNLLGSGGQVTVSIVTSNGTQSREVITGGSLSLQGLQELVTDHLADDSDVSVPLAGPSTEPAAPISQGIPSLSEPGLGESAGDSSTDSITDEDASLAGVSENVPENGGETTTLPPITAQAAMLLGRDRVELQPPVADTAETLNEGGPIEVAQAVAEAQQAHESQLFAEVAARLDAQGALASTTTTPARPLVGELARAVVFEVVGQEPSADQPAEHLPSHAPQAAVPNSGGGPLAAMALKDERDETTSSRALAFAEWPLYFSAALGGVLISQRRRPQAATTQHPPRRRSRQLPAR